MILFEQIMTLYAMWWIYLVCGSRDCVL